MRRLGVSRRHLFETVERPVLASLPAEDYEFAEWRLAASPPITMSSSSPSSDCGNLLHGRLSLM
jgi:hypothetical protein